MGLFLCWSHPQFLVSSIFMGCLHFLGCFPSGGDLHFLGSFFGNAFIIGIVLDFEFVSSFEVVLIFKVVLTFGVVLNFGVVFIFGVILIFYPRSSSI